MSATLPGTGGPSSLDYKATRPDSTNPVGEVALHTHDPCLRHWRLALKNTQYLRSARQKRTVHVKSPLSQRVAFVDSSFAENKQDRRSVSGEAVKYAAGVVS